MQPTPDPLLEWNRLNIANAERGITRALFLGTLSGSAYLDQFSTWLLAGVAGTGALLITQVDSILPFLSEVGFKRCSALLVVAGLFGLLSKIKALVIAITLEQERAIAAAMQPHLDKHEHDEEGIQASAEQRGIPLETEIDIHRAASDYIAAFPAFLHESLQRKLNEGIANPNSHIASTTRGFMWQLVYSALQTTFFAAFVIVAVAYAAAI